MELSSGLDVGMSTSDGSRNLLELLFLELLFLLGHSVLIPMHCTQKYGGHRVSNPGGERTARAAWPNELRAHSH
jgi:hypothetical protein